MKTVKIIALLCFCALLLSSCNKESEPVFLPFENSTADPVLDTLNDIFGTEEESDKGLAEESEKETERDSEKVTEKITEKVTEKLTEKETEKITEKVTEKVTEKETEKKPDPLPSEIPETQNRGHYNDTVEPYYSGNILVCGDYALEYFSSSKSGNQKYADAVNAFAAKYPYLNITALLTPKACAYIAPAGYKTTYDSQKAFIDATYGMLDSGIRLADCASLLEEHKGEYTFYRTDHHWTSLGAYYASEAFCIANGFKVVELNEYETRIGVDHIGSLYNFCKDPKPSCLLGNPDNSIARIPLTPYTMTYVSGGKTYTGKAVNPANKTYSAMFLCGDQPFTHIVTENKNGRKLLVFKESYGNAFVPYMIDYFEEIIAIDFRKDTASVSAIVSQYGITDALIINNVQSAVSLAGTLAAKLAS